MHGFASGLSGVIIKPLEGAADDGVQGLLEGVGRGVVGVVVQPTAGILDCASISLQAINNAIDPKAVPVPVRPPRFFPAGQEMTPYNLHAATGEY